MRPIKSTPFGLKTLIETKSILILNTSLVSVHFVDRLIRQSPAYIKTRQENKTLPLELWLEIIEWAISNPRAHYYQLVQPQRLDGRRTDGTLVCALIPQWNLCGYLEHARAAAHYEMCLYVPNVISHGTRPFLLPGALGEDWKVKVPMTALTEGHAVLFNQLTVPDVIAWIEHGICGLCSQTRRVPESLWWREEIPPFYDGRCFNNLCPLCIGRFYVEGEDGIMNKKEVIAWERARFDELGYDYKPKEDLPQQRTRL